MNPLPRAIILTVAIALALWAAARENAGQPHRGLFPLAFAISLIPWAWDAWEAT